METFTGKRETSLRKQDSGTKVVEGHDDIIDTCDLHNVYVKNVI